MYWPLRLWLVYEDNVPERTRTLVVSSVLPAPPERVFELLARPESLFFVARPLMRFIHRGELSAVWQVGTEYRFDLRLLGWIPLGEQFVRIVCLDFSTRTFETKETGSGVRAWNHNATVERISAGTRLTDRVEIDAGALTRVKCFLAKLFYRHRHRRWRKLLAVSGE